MRAFAVTVHFAETHLAEVIPPKGCFAEEMFRRKDVSQKVHFIESISPNRPFRRMDIS
jgi:hypothetical protein